MWYMIIATALATLATILVHVYVIRPLYFWDRRNVPNIRGWPIVGKQMSVLLRRIAPIEWIRGAYNEFPDKRYSGTTQLNRPILIIRDPKLIKQIVVKDFDHFINRIDIVTDEADELMGKSLLFNKSDDWKSMRCTLSPAFTGSKMRAMFHLMQECADQFTDYFALKCNNTVAVQTREVVSRFATDVIASCAFGVTCNSLKDKNNDFYVMGQEIGAFGARRILKLAVYSIAPILTKLVDIPIFSKRVNNFFRSIVNETLNYREEHNIIRPDMMHLLLEARKGTLKYVEETTKQDAEFAVVEEDALGKDAKNMKTSISNDEITAQALVFFFAGFEPVSTTLSFLLHELALNPFIQKRLHDEIDEVYASNSGKLVYDNVLAMKYLDMVVSETLRKWPAVPLIHRMCTKDYKIPAEEKGESDLLLKKGQALFIPHVAIHHDEKYYPDPQKFDPERFSDENRHKIKPFTYLPFGQGPRNCIGSRFALLEIKIFVCSLIRNFEILAIDKTPQPVKLKWQITLAPDRGFWVGFRRRPKSDNSPYY